MVTPSSNAAAISQILLADPRIEPNLQTTSGETALYYLAAFGQPIVVRLLASDVRVDVNLANSRGETPLFMAAAKDLANVKALLDSGRVKVGPQERERIARNKADWGIAQSPLFEDTK